jgi:cellulose synthase/poly-beta-1,6-N-acetylglucosamine synthase-like glycosyltransferase
MMAATALLSLLVGVVAGILLLPTVSDFITLVSIALRDRPLSDQVPADLPRLVFLVPAHNEELLIESCVRSIMSLRYPAERLRAVVVADNCTDRTARRARAAGAQCLERHDLKLVGKPQAIAWALGRLPVGEYDAVVIVDADTVLDPKFASELASRAPLASKAVQAYFDVRNPDATPLTRMATVLATAIHGLAYPLKQRAGLNVPLVGNGMCLGTDVLARHGWHAFSISEDWEMYALLTAAGVTIECAPRARLYAQEARSLPQCSSQRQRWTAGKLTVLVRMAPRLLVSRQIALRQKLDAIAELAAPGPAVHLGLVLLFSTVAAVLRLPATVALELLLGASLVRPVAYAAVALGRQPEPARVLRAFAFLPVYTLWRIGAVAQAMRMLGDKRWVRTERHRDD